MKQKLPIIIVLMLASLPFWNIFQDEIQPWDEGIYACRIKAVAEYDQWLDQTEYSPGGLYSSAHPPLVIWSNAVFVKIFGNAEYAYRIATSLFGALLIIVVYYMQRNQLSGLIASGILATSSFILYYSSHTQLDVPLTLFIVLGILFFKRYEESRKIMYLIFTGFALGLGLWTKIAVAALLPFIIGIYLLYKIIIKEKKFFPALYELSIILIIGIAIILPWLIFMYGKHGNEFLNYYFFYHILERSVGGVESNSKTMGIFYYLNQLVVHLPLAVAFIILRSKNIIKNKDNLIYIIAFAVPFIIFTIAKTKLATYMLPIMPFLAILGAGYFDKKALQSKFNIREAIIISLIQAWSYFPFLRNDIKSLLRIDVSSEQLLLSSIIFIGMLIITFVYIKLKIKYSLLLIFIFQIISMFLSNNEPERFKGIKAASNYYKQNNINHLYYFRHEYASKVNNTQITFYFDWIDMNQAGNYILKTESLQQDAQEFPDSSMIIVEKGMFESAQIKQGSTNTVVDNDYYKIYTVVK